VRRLRTLAFCLVLAALAGACGPTETAGRGDDSALSPAADFRVRIERLVREHVYLAAFVTEAATTGRGKELQGAVSAFDDNAVAIARELAVQYGEDAEHTFLAMWRRYLPVVPGYATRLAAKKPTAPVLKRLNAFPLEFGALMSSITPLLNPHRAAKQMSDIVAQMTSFIGSQAKKDFAKADLTVRTAGAKAGVLGADLAVAIIEDHPAVLRGDPAAPAALYRATLSGILTENVYLLSLATQNSATHRAAEQKAATAALKANTKQLAAQLGSAYGAGLEKTFTPLWERLSTLILDYAAAGKDKAKKDKALASLRQHTGDLATFFAGVNKEFDRKETGQVIAGLVGRLIAVVDAQVAGDFAAAGVAMRTAAEATEGLGSSIGQATALKYPARFRPARGSSRTPGG
jgi:hypothetical protein